jgi:alpha-beta hydrolase superfamily lysophospholipase
MMVLFVCAALQLGASVEFATAGNVTTSGIHHALGAIRKTAPELAWVASSPNTPAVTPHPDISTYFSFYGLDIPCKLHRFGYVKVKQWSIATHIYYPEGKIRGTVIAAHGYYDHTGTWKHALKALIAHGFAVVIYDQPGHGLSNGARAEIKNFSEYVAVLKMMLASAHKTMPGPYHIVAHSMGCAATMDYLLSDPSASGVDRVVLVAPLVRSMHWRLSTGGQALAKSFVSTVRRKFRKNSSDRAYLRFVKKDPLHARTVPLSWVDALKAWNFRAVKLKASQRKLLIIQGDHDKTVDAKYNLAFLKERFPNRKVMTIKGGDHQLFNELPMMRAKTLSALCSYLSGDDSE